MFINCAGPFWFVTLTWLIVQKTGSGMVLGTVLMAATIRRGVLMLVGRAISDRLPQHHRCDRNRRQYPSKWFVDLAFAKQCLPSLWNRFNFRTIWFIRGLFVSSNLSLITFSEAIFF
jgi:hypothetical protein